MDSILEFWVDSLESFVRLNIVVLRHAMRFSVFLEYHACKNQLNLIILTM